MEEHIKQIVIAALEQRCQSIRAAMKGAELVVIGTMDEIERGRSKRARTIARDELPQYEKNVEHLRRHLAKTMDAIVAVEAMPTK